MKMEVTALLRVGITQEIRIIRVIDNVIHSAGEYSKMIRGCN